MPACEGRSDGPGHHIPCPDRRNDSTVRLQRGDMLLCDSCNSYRFPAKKASQVKQQKRDQIVNTGTKRQHDTRGSASSSAGGVASNSRERSSERSKRDGDGDQDHGTYTSGVCAVCYETVDSTAHVSYVTFAMITFTQLALVCLKMYITSCYLL